ncbi:MAG: ferredoxin [Bacteroidia bacterium]
MSKNLLMVCTSPHPKRTDCTGCKERGGKLLLKQFQQKVEEANLAEAFEVRASACLNNCKNGISVKVHPDQTLYGKLEEADLDEIIERHLKDGKPVERLKCERVNRFMGF